MAKEQKIIKVFVLRAYRIVQNGQLTITKPKTIVEHDEHTAADVVSAGKAEIYSADKHDKLIKKESK